MNLKPKYKGGESYSDPILDTANIKFHYDPKFTQQSTFY